jgi:hypothetical protein
MIVDCCRPSSGRGDRDDRILSKSRASADIPMPEIRLRPSTEEEREPPFRAGSKDDSDAMVIGDRFPVSQ